MHMTYRNTIISGTGSYFPEKVTANQDFINHQFYKPDGKKMEKPGKEIVKKLYEISGIAERRYATKEVDTVYMAKQAGLAAVNAANINPETLDGIIVAHNFGNLKEGDKQSRLLPNVAALVKNALDIKNPKCTAFDLLFGCPGWIQGLIQAHHSIQAKAANKILVIGVETMSRVLDPNDIDTMLFGDGAGAVVLEASNDEEPRGILASEAVSHCQEEVDYLKMGKAYHPECNDRLYLKMDGKHVYKYALNTLPGLIAECLEKASIKAKDIAKFLIHQANEKMIKAIAEKFFQTQKIKNPNINQLLPIIVNKIGNTSVATVPTMLDLIMKNQLSGHKISQNDLILMASVGAGMHSNCILYKF